jgi:hypothetical protein
MQLEVLSDDPSVEPIFSAGTTIYVSRFLDLKPFTRAAMPDVDAPVNNPEKASPKRVTLADVTKNLAIGGGMAAVPLGAIPLANLTTQSQIAAQLTNYGFAPNASSQMASSALNFARSNLGNLCCVFLAGSAVGIGTVEALRPDWSWKQKLIAGGIGGAVLVLLAVVLMYLGVWGHSAVSGQRAVAPTPTKAESKPINAGP